MYFLQLSCRCFLVLLAFISASSVKGDDSACVVELVVQRRTHYSSPGSFLQIHCTVSYCIGGKPHMTWCKWHGEECLIVHEEPGRISTSWREEPATTHPWDFVLTFVSIQLHDTGTYRCMSEALEYISVSHSVLVKVIGDTNSVNVNAVIGQEAALKCEAGSHVRPLLQFWKIETQTAHNCFMSIRFDEKKTFENCSEHIKWTPRSADPSILYVNPVGIADEGLYTFETVDPREGTFLCHFTLKVQVPPVVTLTTYSSRTAVCQAARGKPAANISWEPACEDCIVEYLPHRNRTVTVTSKYRARNDNETSVMCIVSHPTFPVPHTRFGALTAMKSSLSHITILVIRTSVILGLATIVLTLACVFHRKPKKHRMKSPDEMDPPVDSNRSIHGESRL